MPLDAVAIARREQLGRQFDGDGVLLADIAHVGAARDDDLGKLDMSVADAGTAAALHVLIQCLHARERGLGERREPGVDEVAAQVGHQHAVGGEMSRRARDDDFGDAQFARHHGGMERSGAAIGDQREIRRIEAALGRHPAHHMRHFRRGDAQDAFGGFGQRQPERLCDLVVERTFRAFDVELHLAAEKAVGGEPAEHEIGVGDGRLLAAEPVAHRTGHRAGAFRPDAHRAGKPGARDAAAAGADLLDVDHRHLHRQARGIAADQRAAGHQHMAVVNDARLRRRAAHVEGDGVAEAHAVAQNLGADHARGGAGFQHANAGVARFVDVEQPAARLHDEERAVEIRLAADASFITER